jgi:hypothetical protein
VLAALDDTVPSMRLRVASDLDAVAADRDQSLGDQYLDLASRSAKAHGRSCANAREHADVHGVVGGDRNGRLAESVA